MPLIHPGSARDKAGELMSGCGICDGTTTKVLPESCRKLFLMPHCILLP